MKRFYLIDYKEKFTVIVDKLYELDYAVGTISKEQAIKEADKRLELADRFGVAAYIGDDKDLKKVYK